MKHLKYESIKLYLFRIQNIFWILVNRDICFRVQTVQLQHLLIGHANQPKLDHLGLQTTQRIFIKSSIFIEERNTANKTTRTKKNIIYLEMPLFLIRCIMYRQLFKPQEHEFDRGSCCNEQWIQLKTAHRRDTISYRSLFLLPTFNMPYALLLSLFLHIFHTSSTTNCSVCIRKG